MAVTIEEIERVKTIKDSIRIKLNSNYGCAIPATANISQFSDYIEKLYDPGHIIPEKVVHTIISAGVSALFTSRNTLIQTINNRFGLNIPENSTLDNINGYLDTPGTISVSQSELIFNIAGGTTYITVTLSKQSNTWKIK